MTQINFFKFEFYCLPVLLGLNSLDPIILWDSCKACFETSKSSMILISAAHQNAAASKLSRTKVYKLA
jgi:hypothetical protein